jgi:3'-5' exoribonuclease
MKQKKNIFIKEIKEAGPVDSLFLVKEMSQYETKAGKPYLRLILMDNTGEVPAMVWENAQAIAPLCQPGKIGHFAGQALSYKGAMQLKIVKVKKVNDADVDMDQFMPTTSGNIVEMLNELSGLIRSVKNPHLNELLLSFENDDELWTLFGRAPAAKSMHHAYIGGLLEHTLGICRAVDKFAPLYPGIDRDLLMTGAVLHDMGKVKEFSFAVPPFNYSDQGRLLGHMTICVDMLRDKVAKMVDFPEQVTVLLQHLILSHHGRYDYGSPVLPMTREALVLNFLDDLDAKMNYLDRLSPDSAAAEGEYQWTDYQRNMERYFYVTGHPAQTENPAVGISEKIEQAQAATKPASARDAARQPNLWD